MSLFLLCLLGACTFISTFASAELESSQEHLGNKTHEQRLLDYLLQDYKNRRLVRPVKDRSKPVVIGLSAELIGVAKVDEKEQIIKTHFWVRLDWNSAFMTWKPDDYGGVKEIQIPPEMLWVPDVILYNNADDRISLKSTSGFTTYVKVRHDGNQTWRAHVIYRSMCNINVKDFPFDDQTCKLVFASWSHDISTIDLRERRGLEGGKAVAKMERNSDVFQENEEWTVEWITIERNEKENGCCDSPVADLTITMLLRRRTYYYVMSLILPCTLIACTIFLEFILPAESGERVGLGITILLSMAVFQELTSEKLPSSSEHFPLLAMYYSVSIMEIGTALGATCIILNLHHRNTKMPNWFHKIVLEWLAKLVRYQPRVSNRQLAEIDSVDESTQKMIQSNTTSERKRNDAFDLERDSIEFEMDLFDESRGARDQALLSQNGNVPTNHVTRKRSVKRKPQDTETETTEVPISEARFPAYHDISKEECYKKQWQDSARILDRFLLLASIVIGSVSAMAIFLQSPRIRSLFIP